MNESHYLLDYSRTGALISLLYNSHGNYHDSIVTTTVSLKLPHRKTGPESFTSKRLDFLFYEGTFIKVSVFLSFSSADDIKFNLI